MSGAGEKSGEREREVRGAGAERRAGATKVGLSGERQIGRSRSAHMLWSRSLVLPPNLIQSRYSPIKTLIPEQLVDNRLRHIHIQKSLANAKVSARQCVHEGP